ncbi:MAG TPA: IPT/TIG domain-containing protein, partial [Acidimicrobiales bacterium]|nr:IPT/TIG domain-containing protein [Acidimicrobiales bacterium]
MATLIAGAVVATFLVNVPAGAASTRPKVTGLAPAFGPAAGGTTVTITGDNFTGASSVAFGLTAATSFSVVSDTSITAVSPAGTGVVAVVVTSASGASAATSSDKFDYGPTVTGLAPAFGPA